MGYRLDRAFEGFIEPSEVVPAGDLAATLAVHRARALLREAEAADPAAAESLSREALELMPAHPHALQSLAEALVQQDRRDEAVSYAQQALDTPPEHGHQVRELQAILGIGASP